MFENNFLPFSQSKNECFLALDNLPEGNNGMGWAGGEFGYHPQLLFFFCFFVFFKIKF